MTGSRLAAALLTTTALAVGGLGFAADRAADDAVRHLLDGRPDVGVERVSANPFTGRITLHGVTASAGGARLRIGALALPGAATGFGLVGSAEAAPNPGATLFAPKPADTTAADNVVLTWGPTTYRIKRIEMKGTPIDNATLATLLDPKSPETIEKRMLKLDADSVVIPEILADSKIGGYEQHWVEKDIKLDNVVDGHAATASAASGSFAFTGAQVAAGAPTSGATNVDLGPVHVTGLSLAHIAHMAAGPRKDDSEKLATLYESVVTGPIKFTDVTHNQSFTIGAIKEEALKARPFRTDIQADSEKLATMKPNDPAMIAFITDVFNSIEIGKIEVDDFAFVEPPGGDPSGLLGFGMKQMTMSGFGGGRFEGATFNGTHFEGKQGKVQIGSVMLGGFAVPVPKPNAAPGDSVPNIDKMDIGGIDFDMTVPVKNKPDQRIVFKVAHVGFDAPDAVAGQIPAKASFKVDHFAMDIPPGNPAAATFFAMGYKHVDLSSTLDTTYDATKHTLNVAPFSISGVDMGKVDLNIEMANVTNGLVSKNKQVQMAAALGALFKKVAISVRNDGLVDKAIGFKASVDGIPVPQERDALIDMVTNQLPASMGDPPKLKLIGAAIGKFLASPKTLDISASSKNGLGAADTELMSNPQVLLELLDIDASAN